jgi:hypothetical protein
MGMAKSTVLQILVPSPPPPKVQAVPPEASISAFNRSSKLGRVLLYKSCHRVGLGSPNFPKINETMCMSEVPWKATLFDKISMQMQPNAHISTGKM